METFFDCTSVLLHEFDTVGIVVKKTVNEADQQVWIADREQRWGLYEKQKSYLFGKLQTFTHQNLRFSEEHSCVGYDQ